MSGITVRRLAVAIAAFVALVFLGGAFDSGIACAHDPRFACSPRTAADPVVIGDAGKSWAFYGRLDAAQRDHYSFVLSGAQQVPVGILIDTRDASNPARPELTLYDSSHRTIARIGLRPSVRFDEPFSRVSYLSSPPHTLSLQPGTYTAVVGMHGGAAPQRYVFAIGARERFGILEIPFVLGAIYRIHNRIF